MTGIFVIPIITASGPISEDDGVLLPLETWWSGLAESSSLLMTDEEPGEEGKKKQTIIHRNEKPSQGQYTYHTNIPYKCVQKSALL